MPLAQLIIPDPLLSWWTYFGIFNIIAALLSWRRNKEITLAIIAFLLGGLYILYWLITEYN